MIAFWKNIEWADFTIGSNWCTCLSFHFTKIIFFNVYFHLMYLPLHLKFLKMLIIKEIQHDFIKFLQVRRKDKFFWNFSVLKACNIQWVLYSNIYVYNIVMWSFHVQKYSLLPDLYSVWWLQMEHMLPRVHSAPLHHQRKKTCEL